MTQFFSKSALVFLTVPFLVAAKPEKRFSASASFQKFVKQTKMDSQKQTIGEFYERTKNMFTVSYQEAFADWIKANKNRPLPKMVTNIKKGKDGTETVEVVFGINTHARFTIIQIGNTVSFEVGKQKISARDVIEGAPALNKLGFQGKFNSLIPSYATYNKFTPAQRAEFFAKMHNLLIDASAVKTKSIERKTVNVFENKWFHFLTAMNAANAAPDAQKPAGVGKPCYVPSGFVFIETNKECVGNASMYPAVLKPLADKCVKAGKGFCNPFIYGLDKDQPRCHDGVAKAGTETSCGPMKRGSQEYSAVVQSIAQTSETLKGKPLMKDGKAVDENAYNLMKDEILSPMEAYIDQTIKQCRAQSGQKACDDLMANREALSRWIAELRPAEEKKAGASAIAGAGEKKDEGGFSFLKSDYAPLLGFGLVGGLGLLAINADDDKTVSGCPEGQIRRDWWDGAFGCFPDRRMCGVPQTDENGKDTAQLTYGCAILEHPPGGRMWLPADPSAGTSTTTDSGTNTGTTTDTRTGIDTTPINPNSVR